MKEKSASTFRLDEQVYMTMIVVAVFALLLFGFKLATRNPCPPLTLQIQSNSDSSFQAGNLISFQAITATGNEFSWNYGDGTKEEPGEATTLHRFSNSGTYTVAVTVDGSCSEFQNIVITSAPPVNEYIATGIAAPDTAYVGAVTTFEDRSTKAKKWEWYFDNSNRVQASGRTVVHVFKTAGSFPVTLVTDGRKELAQQRYVFVIDKDAENNLAKTNDGKKVKASLPVIIRLHDAPSVQPLPNQAQTVVKPEHEAAAPPPVKKEEDKPVVKAPPVTESQIRAMLMDVVEGKKTAQDFAAYFCGDISKKVVYNMNSVSFSEACSSLSQIKKAKKIKDLKVSLSPDPSTNCQQTMVIKCDLKTGLGKIF